MRSKYEVIDLFFADDDLQFKIVSVLNLSWDGRCEKAMNRPFHALSFRITGDAEFSYDSGSTLVKSKDILFVPKNLIIHKKQKMKSL